jgi:acyl-CoA hydrolase
MSEFLSRIRKKNLHSKKMQAEDTVPFFKNGMDLAGSGFTPVGYPNVVLLALADLRGLCPHKHVRKLISKCALPDYRPILTEYYEHAENECFASGVGHEPHMLFKVFKRQENLAINSTMKLASYE